MPHEGRGVRRRGRRKMCENKIEKHSFSKARGAEETPSLSRSRLSLSRFPSSTEDSLVLCAETWRGERLGYVPGERERGTRIERSLPYWSRSASLYSLERRCTSLLLSCFGKRRSDGAGEADLYEDCPHVRGRWLRRCRGQARACSVCWR